MQSQRLTIRSLFFSRRLRTPYPCFLSVDPSLGVIVTSSIRRTTIRHFPKELCFEYSCVVMCIVVQIGRYSLDAVSPAIWRPAGSLSAVVCPGYQPGFCLGLSVLHD